MFKYFILLNKFMKKLLLLSLILFSSLIYSSNDVHLHVFYGEGCPHCAQLHAYTDYLQNEYDNLIVENHEVYFNNTERILFEKVSRDYNTTIQGVPTVFINDKVIVGFSSSLAKEMEDEIKYCSENECKNPISKNEKIESFIENSIFGENHALTVPIIITAAIVDSINPCAFAVLIILMTAVLSIHDKKKALMFGLAFSASIYISYFLIGIGLISIIQFSGFAHYFYIVVTILAFIVGFLNIKDYFWYGKGVLMEIPLSWRPKMKEILDSVTSPVGAFLAGFAVSLFELPCTGGPYIVILGLLAQEGLKEIGLFYLILYNFVFILPLLILTLIIYKGLSNTEQLEKIRKEKIKLLHLVAGLLMLGIAVVMAYSLMMGLV
jgi:cytochrome c biogenesis protein CcdA/glutaredoxin